MSSIKNSQTVLPERFHRLQEICHGLPVTRSFSLLTEIALPRDLLSLLRHSVSLYILGSLRTAHPDRSYHNHSSLLTDYGSEVLQLPNRTPNGKLVAKQEVALEFNLVQECVELLFKRLNIDSQFEEIQLPVIVRIQPGTPDPVVEGRPYATSKLHSDIWNGESADSAIILIPVLGDAERTGLDFYEPEFSSLDDFARTFADYADTVPFVKTARKYDCVMNTSSLYLMDSFCLHQTVKRHGGIRVSIDLRVRLKKKLPSDVTSDATRLINFVPLADWHTLERGTFLQPTGTFAETVRKYAGVPLSRGGQGSEKEFELLTVN